jgi:hypothetical protein
MIYDLYQETSLFLHLLRRNSVVYNILWENSLYCSIHIVIYAIQVSCFLWLC